MMLTENDVVDAVCRYLTKENFLIVQHCATTQRGIDIIAQHQTRKGRLLVEAKGETSARIGSARHGKEFSASQMFDHIAKCFYSAVRLQSKYADDGDTVAMAFPNTLKIRQYLDPIASTVAKLDLTVYLVERNLSVTIL